VLEWALRHLAKPLSVEDLARRAAMSPRTLARRFRDQTGMTPHQWLTHQRLFAAQKRLETTEENIDQIAESVEMHTVGPLRQHFSRSLGTTPTGYRRRFHCCRSIES
jgi:transcriptional regulator GlxA family with amidase domain